MHPGFPPGHPNQTTRNFRVPDMLPSPINNSPDVGHRVLSWNLCVDQPPFYRWSRGRSQVLEILNHYQADILGFQEVIKERLVDIEQHFPQYRWIGLPRDQKARSQYNPILYRTDRFDLLWHETLWLSPTPSCPSRGWDAVHPRIVTMARLRPRAGDNRDFLIMNCHLDHLGREAKRKSIELLGNLLSRLEERLPVVLLGDFNFSPRSALYRELLKANDLTDSAVDAKGNINRPEKTWRGVVGSGLGSARLDYLFSKNMVVKNYRVIRNHKGKWFPSDHFPIMGEFSFHPVL